MRNVEIDVYMIGHSSLDKENVAKWLSRVGAKNYQLPEATDSSLLVSLAAKRCYNSFEPGLNPNVTKVRKDLVDYFDNILSSGHGSVLEHASYTFAIEGISRVFTGEMNRHRAGWAISEASMRYIRYEDIPYWIPLSLRAKETDNGEISHKKACTRAVFDEVFKFVEEKYKELVKIWDMDTQNFHIKKQITSCLRRIIPMGIATGGIWTGNLRGLRHVLALRCSPGAEEEICYVFSRIGKLISEAEPLIFGDFQETADGFWVPKYAKV